MGLFGTDKNSHEKAKEKVNEISGKLRGEGRALDRQIRTIEREEQKTILMIKDAAKKNQMEVCKIAAKSLVLSKKQKARIYSSKAQINSVVMQMRNQLAQMKIAGAMQASTDVMKSMSKLMSIPEMQRTMQEMSKEMMRAGIIEEMISDTMDSVLDEDDIDTIADAEVEKIILDITQGKLKNLTDVNTASISTGAGASALAAAEDDDDLEENADEEMSKRLEADRKSVV